MRKPKRIRGIATPDPATVTNETAEPLGMGKTIVDPDNYRRVNVPFESDAAFSEAVGVFSAGVKALRDELKLADVYVIVRGQAKKKAGAVGEAVVTMHYGNGALSEILTAAAYGYEKRKHAKAIKAALGET